MSATDDDRRRKVERAVRAGMTAVMCVSAGYFARGQRLRGIVRHVDLATGTLQVVHRPRFRWWGHGAATPLPLRLFGLDPRTGVDSIATLLEGRRVVFVPLFVSAAGLVVRVRVRAPGDLLRRDASALLARTGTVPVREHEPELLSLPFTGTGRDNRALQLQKQLERLQKLTPHNTDTESKWWQRLRARFL